MSEASLSDGAVTSTVVAPSHLPAEIQPMRPLLSSEDVKWRTPASIDSPVERRAIGEKLCQTPHAQSIESLIQSYLQELAANGRLPKTLEWHRTALRLFQQYLMKERALFLLTQVSQADIDGWMASMCTTPTARGTFLAANSMATYGRSARAFCHWVLRQGHVKHLPFAWYPFPRGEKKQLVLPDPEVFNHMLLVCGPCGENGEPQEWATARNRAILWVLWDTGIHASELCGLRLYDVDRASGTVHIRGQGAKERQLVLSPQGQYNVRCYLEKYRCKSGSVVGGPIREDFLFLTETYHPFTKNALTLLFDRLRERAELTEIPVNPSSLRDSFAVRVLQAGGTLETLGAQLGLRTLSALKRYERAARPSSKIKPQKKSVEVQVSSPRSALYKSRRGRKRISSATSRTQRRSGAGTLDGFVSKELVRKTGDDP